MNNRQAKLFTVGLLLAFNLAAFGKNRLWEELELAKALESVEEGQNQDQGVLSELEGDSVSTGSAGVQKPPADQGEEFITADTDTLPTQKSPSKRLRKRSR